MHSLVVTSFLVSIGAACAIACSSSQSGAPEGDAGASSGSSSGTLPNQGDAAASDAGPDTTTIATGLTAASALTVIGTSVYWVENVGGAQTGVTSAIRSAPITGGTPTLVYTPPAGTLNGPLATDGTSLYFAVQLPAGSDTNPMQVMKSALDGTNATTLSVGLPSAPVNGLFFVPNGSEALLYVGAGGSIFTVAATLGINGPSNLPALPLPAFAEPLYWADSSGMYYAVDGNQGATPSGQSFYSAHVPFSGANLLMNVPSAAGPTAVGLAVVGGNVFIDLLDTVASTASIVEVPAFADAGVVAPLASLTDWIPGPLVADTQGMFTTQIAPDNAAYPQGVYSLSLTAGTPTLVHADPHVVPGLAIDSSNVYWVSSSTTGAETLHAKTR